MIQPIDEYEPSWRMYSSARLVIFFHSARNKQSAKIEPKFWLSFFFFFLNNQFGKIGLKMTKLSTMIYRLYYSTPNMSIVLLTFIKIRNFDCSLGVDTKICYFLTYTLSVLSARFQLENWSAPAWLGPAGLGTFIAQLGLSWKIPARTHHYYLALFDRTW